MRIAPCLAVLAAAACSSTPPKAVEHAAAPSSSSATASTSVAPGTHSIDEERAANLAAYQFLYLPEQDRLAADHPGEWLAIVDRRVVPAVGAKPKPAKTMDEADAAARAAAPNAKQRFVFQIGEEGDVEWPMGGCAAREVVGMRFSMMFGDLDETKIRSLEGAELMKALIPEKLKPLLSQGPDGLFYVTPDLGPPDADGKPAAPFCFSTGFGGVAVMSPATAAAAHLELWEIPGRAKVADAAAGPPCRRARARFHWTGSKLDFTLPVAIWPQ